MNTFEKGLTSIIIPVLSLDRKRSLKHPLTPVPGLRELLTNIRETVELPHEVVVICNAPENSELTLFVSSSPLVDRFCLNSVNPGVSRSWNMGAMLAEGEFLCFINDDVQLGRGCLEELKRVLESADDIGNVGPQGGRFQTNGFPGPRVGIDDIEEADEVSGWLFMLRRSVFDLAGGFDVGFSPASYEEVDLSFRIRELGYRCLVVPQAKAIHVNHAGVSCREMRIDYLGKSVSTSELNRRNRERFARKWSTRAGEGGSTGDAGEIKG
jgi:GT2 family glycosyltransferase